MVVFSVHIVSRSADLGVFWPEGGFQISSNRGGRLSILRPRSTTGCETCFDGHSECFCEAESADVNSRQPAPDPDEHLDVFSAFITDAGVVIERDFNFHGVSPSGVSRFQHRILDRELVQVAVSHPEPGTVAGQPQGDGSGHVQFFAVDEQVDHALVVGER